MVFDGVFFIKEIRYLVSYQILLLLTNSPSPKVVTSPGMATYTTSGLPTPGYIQMELFWCLIKTLR